ncbi:Ribonuclease R [Methyloligella halotolerans]|uniref:Ribonuclease R n=1 Tax=Methyloligella halotolerans TaxID=1177755 RepID=A0A1E2S204_9HYPH|nr:Ribonuclease R [Methyloligella halotolerans]
MTGSGLFVQLKETGADGFIPASTVGDEYYYHDEAHRALVGEDTGRAYQLGDMVDVKLVEAIPTAGALRFELLTEGKQIGIKPSGARHRRFRTGARGKPGGRGRGKSKRPGAKPGKRKPASRSGSGKR